MQIKSAHMRKSINGALIMMMVVITGSKEGTQKKADPLLLEQRSHPYPVSSKPSSAL